MNKHQKFIAQLPCCACGTDRSDMHRDGHHLISDRIPGRPDHILVPLCSEGERGCHKALHADGDEQAWAADKVRLWWLAGALWGVTGDYDKACQAIGMAKR